MNCIKGTINDCRAQQRVTLVNSPKSKKLINAFSCRKSKRTSFLNLNSIICFPNNILPSLKLDNSLLLIYVKKDVLEKYDQLYFRQFPAILFYFKKNIFVSLSY